VRSISTIVLLLAASAAPSLPAVAAETVAAPTGLQTKVRFSDYSPLSQATEIERRLFSPVQALRTNTAIAKSGRGVREQSIDLAQEQFAVYVPPIKPDSGYALLVFVPPWETATVPPRWTGELDKHGMIFVTAAKSGNDTSVLDRREPLALLAAHNILQRYPVDPEKVYVGGFSGGSRIAMRLALAYPDLFRGALLDAGSDPIGTAQIRLPPAELMHAFQETSRLVYLTGKDDAPRLEMDAHSRDSMQGWCVFDIKTIIVAWSGHEAAGAAAFNQGLDALETHDKPAPDKVASCRRHYQREMDEQLGKVERLRAEGKARDAEKLLDAIDERFGGLAAPRSVELAKQTEP
jgi:dienelactone hydrolase